MVLHSLVPERNSFDFNQHIIKQFKILVNEQVNNVLLQFGDILNETLAALMVLPGGTRPALHDRRMREGLDPLALPVMKGG